MVEIPDADLAEFVIQHALEVGEIDIPQTAHEGEYGEHEFDMDAELADLDPAKCDVSFEEDHIYVSGTIEGTYQVQTSRGSRMHPPEYRNETVTLAISIHMPFPDIGIPEAHGEYY